MAKKKTSAKLWLVLHSWCALPIWFLRAAGALFGGNPFRPTASVQMPAGTGADAELWVTIEGREGQVSSASVPLGAVLPNTAAFFGRQAGG